MPPGTSSTETVTPGGQWWITWRAIAAAMRAGSWSGTSRHVRYARATAGMTV